MTTEEKIEVMKAFTEGKTIQQKPYNSIDKWTDSEPPLWDWMRFDYRIKPNETYRPYKDTDELISDFIPGDNMGYIPLVWVKSKEFPSTYMLTGFRGDSVVIGNSFETLEGLFRDYVFLDGSPCGKKEEA